MSRAAIVVLLLLAFASGTASGFVLGRSRVAHPIHIDTPDEVLDAMAEEVGLNPAQKAQCHDIQVKFHPDMVKLLSQIKPDRDKIKTQLRAEMSAVMNESQRAAFVQFCTKRDKEREALEK